MTQIDPKALEAAADAIWQLPADEIGNLRALMRRGITAYIAALPPVDVAGLAHEILGAHCSCYAESWPSKSCDDERDAAAKLIATALERLARERDMHHSGEQWYAEHLHIANGQLQRETARAEAAHARIAVLERALSDDMLAEIKRTIPVDPKVADAIFYALRAIASAPKGGDGWLPIESAPKPAPAFPRRCDKCGEYRILGCESLSCDFIAAPPPPEKDGE